MSINIPELTIEIGDNLYLRIKDVSFIPMQVGKFGGLPENCYPDEPAEIDWKDENACLVRSVTKIVELHVKSNGENSRFKTVEEEFPVDDSLVYSYYDEIITQIEEDLENEK